MRVFAHPFRLDGSGSVATVEQGSALQAGQIAEAVVSTVVGERRLAPDFGVPDPAGTGMSAEGIVAAMGICAPDVAVSDIGVSGGVDQVVTLSVTWAEEV